MHARPDRMEHLLNTTTPGPAVSLSTGTVCILHVQVQYSNLSILSRVSNPGKPIPVSKFRSSRVAYKKPPPAASPRLTIRSAIPWIPSGQKAKLAAVGKTWPCAAWNQAFLTQPRRSANGGSPVIRPAAAQMPCIALVGRCTTPPAAVSRTLLHVLWLERRMRGFPMRVLKPPPGSTQSRRYYRGSTPARRRSTGPTHRRSCRQNSARSNTRCSGRRMHARCSYGTGA